MHLYPTWSFYVRLTAALLILFAITACTGIRKGRAMTCDELKSENLHTFIRTNPSELDFTQWVLKEYEGSDPRAADSGQFPFYNFIRWDTDEFEYAAAFDEGALQQVERRIEGANFTLAEALDCLGQPEHYGAFYYPAGGGGAVLTLWYPTNGVVLYFDEKRPRNQTQIEFEGDERLNSITYIATATTLEGAIAAEYGEPLTEHAQEVLGELMPWAADTMPLIVEIPQ